jgi:hypothetical protein
MNILFLTTIIKIYYFNKLPIIENEVYLYKFIYFVVVVVDVVVLYYNKSINQNKI